MKDVLRRWLDRMTASLVDWLLDVVLSDKIAWLEKQIESLPDELIKSQAEARGLDREA